MRNHLKDAPMLRKVNLVFGLGTGRCGTYSLVRLLNEQPGMHCTHEVGFLQWEPNEMKLARNLEFLIARQSPWAADVGFYYLNYVDWILDIYPDARFVCLKRNRTATTKSWLLHTGPGNHWTAQDSIHWRPEMIATATGDYFPKYDLPKKKGAERYWDEYYSKAEKLAEKYEQFRIFDISALDGGHEILEHIGIPEQDRVPMTVHMNRTREALAEHMKLPIQARPCPACNAPGSVVFVHDRRKRFFTWACGKCKNVGDAYDINLEVKKEEPEHALHVAGSL